MADSADEDEYSEEEYEEDDFEEEEEDEVLVSTEVSDKANDVVGNSVKKSGTPHNKKPDKIKDTSGTDGVDAVDGMDLERYMNDLKDPTEGEGGENLAEDLAAELKPLDGMKPAPGSAEQAQLRKRLGYSESSSPASVSNKSFSGKEMYSTASNNQNSPTVAHNTVLGVLAMTNAPNSSSSSSKQPSPVKLEENTQRYDEHPSTHTSKSSKSPVVKKSDKGNKKEEEFMSEIDRYLINLHNSPSGKKNDDIQPGNVSLSSQASAIAAAIEQSSKLHSNKSGVNGNTPIVQGPAAHLKELLHENGVGFNVGSSPLGSGTATDASKGKKSKERSEETDRENATRVDSLLMELFPERYEGTNKKQHLGGNPKKPPQGKIKKPPTNGYKKDLHYGLGARVDQSSDDGMYRSSSGSVLPKHNVSDISAQYADHNEDSNNSGGSSALSSLDQQIKRLKKDIRTKDDKIKRITEHAIMMANHMDKLKGEAAMLRDNMHKAHMVIEAKDARIDELSKRKKKVVVRRVRVAAEGGSDPDVAALNADNQRLRDREQALVDALEDLSAQNEELIMKLKESMERELELSSKRAAQINHHLPHIIGKSGSVSAGGEHVHHQNNRQDNRARSEPIDELAAPKRTRKKK